VARPIPIYRTGEEPLQADTCQPLVEAASRRAVRLQALIHGHYPGKSLPVDALPGIKTVGFWDAESAQNWGLPPHRNEGIEITFLEMGRLAFGVDDQNYELKADDLTITRPWQRHHVGDPNVGACRLIWVILDVGVRRPNQPWKWPRWVILSQPDLDDLSHFLRHTERPVWQSSSEIRRCFQTIAETVESGQNGGGVSSLTVRLNELFLLLLDMFRHHRVPLDESLSSSRRTVELFLADLRSHGEHLALEWTLRQMADSCGIGTTQFAYHVKRLVNMTPLHYLNHCRLEHAAMMLRADVHSNVTDVALRCGFSSSQYFATTFSTRFGCSPTEYRRMAPASAAV
jgi:AraC-like DNA-binding protein